MLTGSPQRPSEKYGAVVGPRPVAAEPAHQHRAGDAEVGEVEHDDRDRGERQERALVGDVDRQQREREDAGDQRRHDRHLAARPTRARSRAERQPAVARHREQHPDASRSGPPGSRRRSRAPQSTRNTLPVVLPSACLMTYGRPSRPMFLSWMFLIDMIASRITQPADHRRGRDRADDRRRRVLARVVGLLGERARGVEPVHHVRAHDPADQQRAEVAPRVAGAEAVGVDDRPPGRGGGGTAAG